MAGFRDLEIYNIAFDLAIEVHHASLKLPKFELFEQGSQIRRASKSIKDTLAEGYGRRRYKADYVKFLVYAQASCDETINQIDSIQTLYPEHKEWSRLFEAYDILGKKINNYIQYVDKNWKA